MSLEEINSMLKMVEDAKELFTPPLIKVIEAIDLKNTPAKIAYMSGFYKRVEYTLSGLWDDGKSRDFIIYRTGLKAYKFYLDDIELFNHLFSAEFLERVHTYMENL